MHAQTGDNILPILLLLAPDALARVLPTGTSAHPALDALLFEAGVRLLGTDFALVLVLPAALLRAEGVLLGALEADLFQPGRPRGGNFDDRFVPLVREIPTARARASPRFCLAYAAMQGYVSELTALWCRVCTRSTSSVQSCIPLMTTTSLARCDPPGQAMLWYSVGLYISASRTRFGTARVNWRHTACT